MFEKLVATIIGRKIVKKLDLQEASQMEKKPIWKSKAVWSAVLMALVGAVQPISSALGHPVTVPNWIVEVLAGFGIYGIRAGDKPLA